MMRQILAIIRKDLRQARRDPRFVAPSLIVPFVFLLVYTIMWTSVGGGESFACGLVVEDHTIHGEEMAAIIEDMRSTTNHTWFSVTRYDVDEAAQRFVSGDLIAYIVIPAGFGANISDGLDAKLVLYCNNVNDDVVKNYVHRIEAAVLLFNQGARSPDFDQSDAIVALEETLNLTSTPSNLTYMAAAAVVLSVITCALAGQALSTASEFETNAIQETLNSPTSRLVIIIGRTVAAIPRSLIVLMITYPIVYFFFGLVPLGNFVVLLLILVFTILALVPLGELIGIITKKRETALLGAVLLAVLGFLTGGGMAPVGLLPVEFRTITMLLPTTHSISMWTRIFFFDTVNGLLPGFIALSVMWLLGTAAVTLLTRREVERS